MKHSVVSEAGVCSLAVDGMDCSSCADTVERALRKVDGVRDVRVDVVGGRVSVRHTAGAVERASLVSAVQAAGYRVRPEAAAKTGTEDAAMRRDRRMRLGLAAAAGVLWVGSLAAAHAFAAPAVAATLAVGAMVAGGWTIVPRGVRALRSGSMDMNFLMTIAALGALFIGEYAEAASALFLFAVAQLLETWSMDRARNAIRALMQLSPEEATVLRDGAEVRIRADQVRPDEVVVVRPGGKIPVDGVVVRGASGVDQSPITGESLPVDKDPGDDVFAGTLNGSGVLEVRCTRSADDTTLARIIHSVEEAQASRAPSQAFVDRFARVYTPVVVVAALLVFVGPPLLGFGAWGEWFYRALVLLVVACPCALVISTPVTVVSALAGAARRGILIKGGLHLENAGRARIIALDKTGTLTLGEPEVHSVLVLQEGHSERDVLAAAACAEARSEHPLARAVVRAAAAAGIEAALPDSVTAVPGRGVRAVAGRRTLHAGSERYFRELGIWTERVETATTDARRGGQTAVLVAESAHTGTPVLLGMLMISDTVRPDAARSLRALHAAGVEHVVMLTGDSSGAATAVADALGDGALDDVRSGLLPEDKVAAVRELRRRGRVMMVGDGVNDAPALAAADVGVAMGTAGTDVALETADIALMGDDLSRLPELVAFARKAERIIRTNIGFALVTKAAFVLLAVAGVATLWMAVLADMGASLLVILNGLRALRA